MAKLVRSRWAVAAVPAAAVVVIYVLDRWQYGGHYWDRTDTALLDEPAHLSTALVFLLVALPSLRSVWRSWFVVAACVGSMAIDLDHVALYSGVHGVAVDGGRPFTHSLATSAVLLVAALVFRGRMRANLAGLALGVLLHLVRDLATGPGVPLFWPLSDHSVLLHYGTYRVVVFVVAVVATLRIGTARVPGAGQSMSGAATEQAISEVVR